MNTRLRFHHGEYDICANEALYASMAANGWQLARRGAYLSRFKRAEPEQRLYRIEYSTEAALPEDQLELYAECGWAHICSRGILHIFTAPSGRGIPEIHTDPKLQAPILKRLRRRHIISLLVSLIVIALSVLFIAALSGPGEARAELALGFYGATALCCFYITLFILLIYSAIRESVQLTLLYRRLNRGEPLDRSGGRRLPHRILRGAMLSACAVFLLLFVFQLSCHEKWAPDAAPENPCISLTELGLAGKQSTNPVNNDDSCVTYDRSLLLEYWSSDEYVETEDVFASMYVHCYVLKGEDAAARLLPALLETAILASAEGFEEKSFPGLDEAYSAELEYVARSGSTLWYVTLLAPEGAGFADKAESVFSALAAK